MTLFPLSRIAGEGGEPTPKAGEGEGSRSSPHPPIAYAWATPSPAMRERGYRVDARHHPLTSGHSLPPGRLKASSPGIVRIELVEIPFAFRFLRLLDLEQVHVADQPAVLADLAVLGHEVVDRGFLHLLDDGRPVERVGRLDRVQLVRHRAVIAGLNHRRRALHLFEEAASRRRASRRSGPSRMPRSTAARWRSSGRGCGRRSGRPAAPRASGRRSTMPNSAACLIELIVSPPALARPMILAFEACACSRKEEKSERVQRVPCTGPAPCRRFP